MGPRWPKVAQGGPACRAGCPKGGTTKGGTKVHTGAGCSGRAGWGARALGRWGVAERRGSATQEPAVNTKEGHVGPRRPPDDPWVWVGSPGSAGESQSKPRRRYQRCPGATWDGRPGVEDGVSGGRRRRIRREGPRGGHRGGAPASADAFPSWARRTNPGHWRCLAGREGQAQREERG